MYYLDIIIGVFSALIGAFLWEILRVPFFSLSSWIKKRYIWNKLFDSGENLYIASSVIDVPKKSVRVSDKIVEQALLDKLRKSVNIFSEDPGFNINHPDTNLIIIGSPRYNKYAELVQKKIELNYEYVFDSYETEPAKKILKIVSQYGDGYVSSSDLKTDRGKLAIEYGLLFIGRIKNDKKIYWISGIHGAGTIGVFKYFENNVNVFLRKCPKNGEYGKCWLFRVQYKQNLQESFNMIKDVELIGESQKCAPRQITHKPKGLICDFGNVITLFDRNRTYRAIGHWFGLSHMDVLRKIENTHLRQKYEKGELSDEEFYNQIISLLNVNRKMPYEIFSEFWGDIFWPNRTMIEVLNLLKNEVTLVLLSNTNHLHFNNVKEHYKDIISLFDNRMVLSYEEKMAKPDKKMFEKAVSVAGSDINYRDCIYVDDKVEYVNVARELGMEGIVFYGYPQFVYRMRKLGLYIP